MSKKGSNEFGLFGNLFDLDGDKKTDFFEFSLLFDELQQYEEKKHMTCETKVMDIDDIEIDGIQGGKAVITIIVVLILVVAYVAERMYLSSQVEKFRNEQEKLNNEVIQRRKNYIKTVGENTYIVVNNGDYFFFKDNVQQVFGVDESGKTYSFAGVNSLSEYEDSVSIFHQDMAGIICIGKDVTASNKTIPLDKDSIAAIKKEMMPVVRKNLYKELEIYGVNPTHEYEHKGEIWGCDINSRKFYTTYGCPQIFDFNDLVSVTVKDVGNNIYISCEKIMHITIWTDCNCDAIEYDIYFDTAGIDYTNLLAMFKGIRNRQ